MEQQRADLHTSTLATIELSQSARLLGVSSSRALAVPAVYRGAQLLSDLAGSLPWFAYAGGRHSGSRQVVLPRRLDELPQILVQPDPLTSRDQWIRDVVLSLVFRGNAYLFGSLYVEGHPTRVQVLNPDDVSVSWADNAQTFRSYRYGADTELPASRLRHLALNLTPGALIGVGPIQAGFDVIAGQLAADSWARAIFEGAGTPSGKLIHPGKLDFEEAQLLAEQWDAQHVGARQTAVLSGGMDFQTVSLTPDQAQFLQARSFGVAEIARLLGIPAHLLNASTGVAGSSGASMTYQNVKQVFTELAQMTLKPVYTDRIGEAMSSYLPRGTSAIFDFTDFVRPDTATRYESAAVALSAGFLTVDEVRSAEGLPPDAELNDRATTREGENAALDNQP